MARNPDSAHGDEQRAVALNRSFQELNAVLESLPARFPEAYGGIYAGPTNDDLNIQILDGAPGAEELRAAVLQAEQRALDQVGVCFRFHFEPASLTHARLDSVRVELTSEMVNQGEAADLGCIGIGLGRSCVAITTRPGRSGAARVALRSRFPDVSFRFDESEGFRKA